MFIDLDVIFISTESKLISCIRQRTNAKKKGYSVRFFFFVTGQKAERSYTKANEHEARFAVCHYFA
jgi:hypothetical protein